MKNFKLRILILALFLSNFILAATADSMDPVPDAGFHFYAAHPQEVLLIVDLRQIKQTYDRVIIQKKHNDTTFEAIAVFNAGKATALVLADYHSGETSVHYRILGYRGAGLFDIVAEETYYPNSFESEKVEVEEINEITLLSDPHLFIE